MTLGYGIIGVGQMGREHIKVRVDSDGARHKILPTSKDTGRQAKRRHSLVPPSLTPLYTCMSLQNLQLLREDGMDLRLTAVADSHAESLELTRALLDTLPDMGKPQ
eukprot:11068763-Prorocentrum_lima.AAC.1